MSDILFTNASNNNNNAPERALGEACQTDDVT